MKDIVFNNLNHISSFHPLEFRVKAEHHQATSLIEILDAGLGPQQSNPKPLNLADSVSCIDDIVEDGPGLLLSVPTCGPGLLPLGCHIGKSRVGEGRLLL